MLKELVSTIDITYNSYEILEKLINGSVYDVVVMELIPLLTCQIRRLQMEYSKGQLVVLISKNFSYQAAANLEAAGVEIVLQKVDFFRHIHDIVSTDQKEL